MPIVDTHCHVSLSWYNPVESLLFEMDRNGVEHALLVQMAGEYDNGYQSACVERFPDRFASIVLVDPARPDAPDRLEELAQRGAAGVRLPAATRSPGDDPLAIWRTAEGLDLVVSCPGGAAAFTGDAFTELVEAVPNLQIMIEHLGGVKQRDDPEPPYPLARSVFAVARHPNLCMKIHGLGEFATRRMPVGGFPFEEPVPPYLDMVYDAFGPDRIVWGSDYPPVSGREGYRNALELTRRQLAGKPADALDKIFGGNALRLFPGLYS